MDFGLIWGVILICFARFGLTLWLLQSASIAYIYQRLQLNRPQPKLAIRIDVASLETIQNPLFENVFL